MRLHVVLYEIPRINYSSNSDNFIKFDSIFYYNSIWYKFMCRTKTYFITALPMTTDLGQLEADFFILKYDI